MCVFSSCDAKHIQSCGVVSTRSPVALISFCHTQTHTASQRGRRVHPHTQRILLPLSLLQLRSSLPPSSLLLSVSTLHPRRLQETSSLPLSVFSFLLSGHTPSVSQRSTGKALTVSLNTYRIPGQLTVWTNWISVLINIHIGPYINISCSFSSFFTNIWLTFCYFIWLQKKNHSTP